MFTVTDPKRRRQGVRRGFCLSSGNTMAGAGPVGERRMWLCTELHMEFLGRVVDEGTVWD